MFRMPNFIILQTVRRYRDPCGHRRAALASPQNGNEQQNTNKLIIAFHSGHHLIFLFRFLLVQAPLLATAAFANGY